MRARIFLLAFSAASLAAGLSMEACGGESTTTAPPADAGRDVTVDSNPAPVPDTGAPDTGPGCDTNADFTTGIPDASIADGASTSGICVSCAKSKCQIALSQCNKLCECQKAARDGLDCYLKTPDIAKCAAAFAGVSQQTQGIGFNLFSCIGQQCRQECAVDVLLPDGGDGGDGG